MGYLLMILRVRFCRIYFGWYYTSFSESMVPWRGKVQVSGTKLFIGCWGVEKMLRRYRTDIEILIEFKRYYMLHRYYCDRLTALSIRFISTSNLNGSSLWPIIYLLTSIYFLTQLYSEKKLITTIFLKHEEEHLSKKLNKIFINISCLKILTLQKLECIDSSGKNWKTPIYYGFLWQIHLHPNNTYRSFIVYYYLFRCRLMICVYLW